MRGRKVSPNPLLPRRRPRRKDLLIHERGLLAQGHRWIAGVDEAGRGCLAGPVFAGAVILPPRLLIPDVDDSKKLSPDTRERLFEEICRYAVSWSVASVPADEIDRINIHWASLKVMRLAVEKLSPLPQYVLIDGKFTLDVGAIHQKAIIDGDALSQSIAAASILAKVSRDRWIAEQEKKYPQFRFSKHKGYGTAQHRREIAEHGLTPLHRRSFRLTR